MVGVKPTAAVVSVVHVARKMPSSGATKGDVPSIILNGGSDSVFVEPEESEKTSVLSDAEVPNGKELRWEDEACPGPESESPAESESCAIDSLQRRSPEGMKAAPLGPETDRESGLGCVA